MLLAQGAAAQSIVQLGPSAPLPTFLDAPQETGAERSFTQLTWDDTAQALDRTTYTIWDLLAQEALVLTWEPLGEAAPSGPLSGEGVLSWRLPDRASLDRSALVAQYRGAFAEGFAVGDGQFWHRSGLVYRGEWLDGLFHGEGRLQWPDGREYLGAFAEGLPHGQGSMLFPNGEIFFGDFVQGRPDGTGILYPVDRPAERVIWPAHEDRPTAAQPIEGPAGTAHLLQVQQTQGEVSLALSLSPNSRSLRGEGLPYRSESDGQTLRILPQDGAFLQRWRGESPLRTDDGPGDFWVSPEPIPLIVQLENRSVAPAQVVLMYIEVDESPAEMTPAIWAYSERCRSDRRGQFEIHRSAGAYPTNLRIEGGFPAGFDAGIVSPVAFDVVEEWPLVIDFRQLIAGLGGSLGGLLEQPVDCRGVDGTQCMESLRGQGAFGALTNEVYRRGDCLLVDFVGTFDYEWTDHNGTLQSQSRPLEAVIGVGALAPDPQTAEFGDGLGQIPDAEEFRVGESNYRLPINLTATVPEGRAQRWEFYVEAPESVTARFRVVFQLADGREIRSRDVDLLYYRSR